MLRAIIWCAVSTQAQAEDEKLSLPYQEKEAREICERSGWIVEEVLTVPGHSRRYIDIYECARDMSNQGIESFNRLLDLWNNRAFDVLVVRDASRFARTQTLHSHVVERTIEIGARIYSMQDGWIDESNHRMWIAMGGYSSAGEIDRLVKSRKIAMDSYVQRGLPISSVFVMSHKVVRNEKGKATGLMLDENHRRLWDDLATLLLEGVAWREMENQLFGRFGHANSYGEPYQRMKFHKILNTLSFLGARGKTS